MLTFKCKLPCFRAHPRFSSVAQCDVEHPSGRGISRPESLWLYFKKTSSDATTAPNASTIVEVGRSRMRGGRIRFRPHCAWVAVINQRQCDLLNKKDSACAQNHGKILTFILWALWHSPTVQKQALWINWLLYRVIRCTCVSVWGSEPRLYPKIAQKKRLLQTCDPKRDLAG